MLIWLKKIFKIKTKVEENLEEVVLAPRSSGCSTKTKISSGW